MSRYFDQVDLPRLRREYPIGDAFLQGAARLDRAALRALQEARFLRVVARAWEVPFYDRRWRAAGLEPGDITSLSDLEKIPPFSKSDLTESIEAHPPFGDYHGMSPDAALSTVLHTTSGTTGAPQPLYFGAYDREVQNALLARAYRLQGLRDDDVVHSVYGFGMVNGGHYVREAVLHFTNALYLPAGTGLETPSEQQVALMSRFRASVLVGFVDYLKRLAEVAREQGREPGRDPPVRMISGHIGQEDPAHVSELWGGAEVFDWYGVGDTGTIAAEGPEHEGLYIWEDAHLVEVLDPDTGAVREEGQGSLCTTVLFKDTIYPVVRFNTSDVTTVLPIDTRLPVHFRRMAGFQGRADAMVKLRGINVYPSAIGPLLDGFPEATGEYLCRLERVSGQDALTVAIEIRGAPGEALTEGLAGRLAEHLRAALGVRMGVELCAPGSLAEITGVERRQKPIRLVDER